MKKLFLIISVLALFLYGCSGSFSPGIFSWTSTDSGLSCKVLNSTTEELIVNINGFLYPLLSPGGESESCFIILWEPESLYIALSPPDLSLPVWEREITFTKSLTNRYLLTISGRQTETEEYNLEIKWQ